MFRLAIPCLTLLTLLVAGGKCRAVDSAVTIDSLTKTANGANFDISFAGKVTLGTNDTYQGTLVYLTKPNGMQIPMSLNLTPPAAGQTANYTAGPTTQAGMAGQWKATIDMTVISGGNTKHITTFVNFTVP